MDIHRDAELIRLEFAGPSFVFLERLQGGQDVSRLHRRLFPPVPQGVVSPGVVAVLLYRQVAPSRFRRTPRRLPILGRIGVRGRDVQRSAVGVALGVRQCDPAPPSLAFVPHEEDARVTVRHLDRDV